MPNHCQPVVQKGYYFCLRSKKLFSFLMVTVQTLTRRRTPIRTVSTHIICLLWSSVTCLMTSLHMTHSVLRVSKMGSQNARVKHLFTYLLSLLRSFALQMQSLAMFFCFFFLYIPYTYLAGNALGHLTPRLLSHIYIMICMRAFHI